MNNPDRQTFDGVIKDAGGGGCFVDFPYDVYALYGQRGLIKVAATIDGIPYRGSLANMGTGGHILIVLKAIREQIGKGPGDSVHVTVELDKAPRVIEPPADLQKALNHNPKAQSKFEKLAYSHKREYIRWIEDAKKPETRQRRIEQTIERLLA